MSIEIKFNPDTNDKELYLFGEFQRSWHATVDDMKTIVPYAVNRALIIGKELKAREIRVALNLQID